jgi:hypothetical protein
MHELGGTELRKEPEMVTVNGLQFKRYQMSWIREMAKRYNHGSVNEFIINIVLTDLLGKLEKLTWKSMLKRLIRI